MREMYSAVGAGLRLLLKDPAYSLVAVLGLSVALAVCLLLLGYARYSWQYNAQIPDVDHVYVVEQRQNKPGKPWSEHAPVLLRTVAAAAPGVAVASGYVTWFPLTMTVNGMPHKLRSLAALPGFAKITGLQAVRGDLDEALTRPDAIAITEAAALRLFGASDALGRTVVLSTVDDGNPDNPPSNAIVRIAAVLRNPPANTTISYEALHGPKLAIVPSPMSEEALSGAQGFPGNLLLRLRPGASLTAITAVLQRAVDQAPALQKIPAEGEAHPGTRSVVEIKLSPLRDAYFERALVTDFLSVPVDRGDARVVRSLAIIGVLVLALAAINYVNLTTIRVIRRQREIAIRKVLGARKGRLAQQFVAESLLVSMAATMVGLLLAWLALPVFSTLMSRDLGSIWELGNVAAALCIGVALGLATAAYPVWIALGVRPALILAGRSNAESTNSRRLRRALSIVQMAVAIGLAGYTMAIFWQTRYAIDASPGFDPARLLVLDFPDAVTFRKSENASHFMAALSRQRTVAGVAVSNDPVGRSKNSWSSEVKREGGQATNMEAKLVSVRFFEQYGIKPVAGRLFDPKIDREEAAEPVVINAIAARQLGFATVQQAVGQTLLFRNALPDVPDLVSKRIVGVAPEIRYRSLREVPQAVAYELWMGDVTLTVRASGSVLDAERSVRRLWPRYFPNAELEISAAKDVYAGNYADDARLAALLAIATLMTMIIAAFGAYVLAADSVQRRSGEIAMHKLFGARRTEVGRLIAKEFALSLIAAAALALPVAAVAIARHLAPYTERSPLAYWSLAIALLAAFAVVALAAARHVGIAIALKPAQVLRNS